MGTYLSQPNRDKNCEEGEDLSGETPAAWGVVDMQGWRKTMEDAHFASSNVRPPGIGVYPGDSYKWRLASKNVQRPIDDSSNNSPMLKTMVFAVFDGHGGPEVARFCQLYLLHILTKQEYWNSPNPDIGRALISSFHELDRMIDDLQRRDEIMNLKSEKPEIGEYRAVANTAAEEHVTSLNVIGESFSDEKKLDAGRYIEVIQSDVLPDSDMLPCDNDLENVDSSKNIDIASENYQECFSDEIPSQEDSNIGSNSLVETDEDDGCDILNEEVGEHAVSLFKQFLHLNSSSQDKGIVKFDPRTVSVNGSEVTITATEATVEATAPGRDSSDGRSVFQPTLIINGKQTCNLPEHPVHAGCTAICAVITGRILTVANAGDSRAVLCRGGGIVEPLSFDHKPTQDREMDRIVSAGGFVNQFGRVNGNLNLSRSIGDLKYKQVPGIPPSGQMITAEPDITQFQLDDRDEFIIIGCDGIWDCLCNEEAVAFVRQRIDFKTPVEIGIEMLDTIVSVDPRTTQGIGGDNMTIMIIDLMPSKRSYRINTLS